MQVFETPQADDPPQFGLYRIVARLGAGGIGMSTWAAAAVPHRREEISRRRTLLILSSLGLSTAGFIGWRIYETVLSLTIPMPLAACAGPSTPTALYGRVQRWWTAAERSLNIARHSGEGRRANECCGT